MESAEQNNMNVVEAKGDDMDAVFMLRLLARQTDAGIFPTSYEEERRKPLEEKLKWFNNPKQIVMLAKMYNEAVGMMAAREKDKGTWYLHGVYVRPEFRGRKIADALMNSIVQRVRERLDAKVLTFQVEANNQAAIDLYTKHGFEVVGRDSAVMGDGKEHAKIIMAQSLDKVV